MTYSVDDFQAGRTPPKGWDVADAADAGWSKADIEAFMRATAQPWTPREPDPTPDPEPETETEMPPAPPPREPEPERMPEPPRAPARSYAELHEAAHNASPENMDGVVDILREARELAPVYQDGILQALKASTKIGLTTLRKTMREGDDERGADHLELARRTIESIGTQNVICAGPFVWMWSDAGVWKQRDDRTVKQRVQHTIENEGLPVNSTVVSGVSDVLKTEIHKPDHQFNLGHPETINCINGQIEPDGDGWALVDHKRENYRTTQIPVEYDPKATAPLFEKYLGEIFEEDEDREDKIKALLELMGYTLMSHARHELFVILIGSGANGKSVLLHVLEKLCGAENVAGVQPSNFDRSFQRAHLDQKLANIVTEIRQGEVIADAELKGIVSGEKSTVEHKFQDPFDMHPFATCWFGTNHMPHTRDFSDALFRRALILTFNRTFLPHQKDPTLKTKLEQELPGILNMALAAYGRASQHGFTMPASSEAAKQEWRLEADQVAMFVEDRCETDEAARESVTDLFEAYQDWAKKNGISKTMSVKGLRDRLTKLGFGQARDSRGRYVTGIRVPFQGGGDYQNW